MSTLTTGALIGQQFKLVACEKFNTICARLLLPARRRATELLGHLSQLEARSRTKDRPSRLARRLGGFVFVRFVRLPLGGSRAGEEATCRERKWLIARALNSARELLSATTVSPPLAVCQF